MKLSKKRFRKDGRKRLSRVEKLEDRYLLMADWRSPANPFDVNQDITVTALDALVVINFLGRIGSNSALGPRPESSDEPFVDVNGDGSATALDALDVINLINRHGTGKGFAISESGFDSSRSFSITSGQLTGQRNFRFRIDTAFDRTDTETNIGDLVNIYLVSQGDPTTTRVDRGSGTAIASFHEDGTFESALGLVSVSNDTYDIDLSSVTDTDTIELVIQYLNQDVDGNGAARIIPLSNQVKPNHSPRSFFATSATNAQPSPAVDLSTLSEATDAETHFENIRFSRETGKYKADLFVSSTASLGRQTVVVFPGLADGVQLITASGVSSTQGPYVNLAEALGSGGIVAGEESARTALEFQLPAGVTFQ
ncbi:hypothetical protein RMSM_02096, partial [Rhodopirellula maiorica SM1]